MTNEQKLRELIRKRVNELLDEISTSAGAGPYLTPNAFVGDKNSNTDRQRQMAKKIGYSLTKKGEDDDTGDKLTENYYAYRNDSTKLPHQKIGDAIAEVSRQLNLVERALRLNSRLQKECGVTNDKLWKRTTHHMFKLENRMIKLASKLREMRG